MIGPSELDPSEHETQRTTIKIGPIYNP